MINALSIDVEEWFHILSARAPRINTWASLESRVERNVERLLEMLDEFSVKATFFWLGWVAQQHKSLLLKCHNMGHEIASHGYDHHPHDRAPLEVFRRDILKTRHILEDIVGKRVIGHRAPGCRINGEESRIFEVIKEAGYEYDSSLFPVYNRRGLVFGQFRPHAIQTSAGTLIEVPVPTIRILGCRWSFFGGGYLRLSPIWLIRYGINRLHKECDPLVVYVHPREIDPDHPRLPLGPLDRFKCYVNLETTMPKLRWLCENYTFILMWELAARYDH